MTENGVVFVATGARYAAAAEAAARSVRERMPAVEIDLFTDADARPAVFDRIHPIETPHRRSKVDCLQASRFANTLYLDSDTRVVADVSDLFALMERFDLALAHAHARARPQTMARWRLDLPEAFCQFNSGVFVYRKSPKMQALLGKWGDAFREAGFAKDQVALRELIWTEGIALHVLPPEYNIRYDKYLRLWKPDEARPKILHMRAFNEPGQPGERFDLGRFRAGYRRRQAAELWTRLRRRLG